MRKLWPPWKNTMGEDIVIGSKSEFEIKIRNWLLRIFKWNPWNANEPWMTLQQITVRLRCPLLSFSNKSKLTKIERLQTGIQSYFFPTTKEEDSRLNRNKIWFGSKESKLIDFLSFEKRRKIFPDFPDHFNSHLHQFYSQEFSDRRLLLPV